MKPVSRAAAGSYSELTFDAMTHYLYRYAAEGPLAILVHARPDGDCVGSAFAMQALLAEIGCEARVVCQDKLPERLKFLAADGVQDEITAASAGAVYAPDTGARAISLDVAAISQLGALENSYNVVLALDHHSSSAAFSDRYLDSGASATGEIVWRIARNWLRAGIIRSIPVQTAKCVYAAISSDTGCFRYSNVTPTTHRIAAQLIEHIPDHAEIDRQLYEVKTAGRLAAEEAAEDVVRSFCGGRITVCPMTRREIDERGLADEELDALIDVARSVPGTEIAFSIRGEEDGSFRVSSRANQNADVSRICEKFGGGGHTRAAGCSIRAESLSEAIKIMVNEAEQALGTVV